ncbi:MAG: hypothetical protein EAZ91_20350 [Cytophagales bacterium]|nr:MAG: hypothetical protein EAZ91_20350 [Cytophagales bacterium]
MKPLLLLLIGLCLSANQTALTPIMAPPKPLVGGTTQPPINLFSQLPSWPSTGQITLPVRDVLAQLNRLPAGTVSGLGSLLPLAGAEPRYVAVGGSLTAGFRNGGLYREAQLTAYPNLIARQMGLTNFRQPLFSVEQGNGSGYKQLLPGTSFPQYQDIVNERAVVSDGPLTLTSFAGQADNLGMPFLGVHTAFADEEWRLNDKVRPGVPYEQAFRPYFRRLLPNDNQQWLTGYVPYILGQKSDIMTIELGMDDAIWYASSGGYRLSGAIAQAAMAEGSPIIALLSDSKAKQGRAVIATVPDVLQFPFFSFYPTAQVRKNNGGQKLYAVVDDRYDLVDDKTRYVAEVSDTDILLPSIDVRALATTRQASKGLSPNSPLGSRDVLSADEITALKKIDNLNSLIRFQAARANVPVVDLQGLYAKILSGQYVTEDGLQLDPSFPNGNFFSSDGLYPSAIGQAVIANEWIKTINRHYKTGIPLISTKRFQQTIRN